MPSNLRYFKQFINFPSSNTTNAKHGASVHPGDVGAAGALLFLLESIQTPRLGAAAHPATTTLHFQQQRMTFLSEFA